MAVTHWPPTSCIMWLVTPEPNVTERSEEVRAGNMESIRLPGDVACSDFCNLQKSSEPPRIPGTSPTQTASTRCTCIYVFVFDAV
ncbi:hypothetical protein FF1_041241 [Malus domestica]